MISNVLPRHVGNDLVSQPCVADRDGIGISPPSLSSFMLLGPDAFPSQPSVSESQTWEPPEVLTLFLEGLGPLTT